MAASKASTLTTNGTINNKGTQNPIDFINYYDWEGGRTKDNPRTVPYGKPAPFTHTSSSLRDSGALVYRCKNPFGGESDWLFSWINDQTSGGVKKAYTGIQIPGYPWDWEDVKKKTEEAKSDSMYEADGLRATVSIGEDGYKAKITIP